MNEPLPRIAILGASGLIGEALASWLFYEGFPVTPIARRFTRSQKAAFGRTTVEAPLVDSDVEALADLLSASRADIVVNCIGVLQDSARGRTGEVHQGFVSRLTTALARQGNDTLLIHISIPGQDDDDRTPFSLTKREAERVIAASTIPHIILRPGFVIAPAAYGGSALIRALAMLPVDLSPCEAGVPFAATDVGDIARTIAHLARRWQSGERHWQACWEVMERHPATIGAVVDAFRDRLGGPRAKLPLPSWSMALGAAAGDLAAQLGWSPPIRRTALRELRRGVTGDPDPWIAATGIEPAGLEDMVRRLPATVQEKWFARLYLLKPLIIGVLAVFWAVSGLIALTVSFNEAAAILTAHGFSLPLAQGVTAASSLLDISIGIAIAFRISCRAALLLGIATSLFYMVGAAVLTPELWLEPLGALVKTLPAIVLMIVTLATLQDR